MCEICQSPNCIFISAEEAATVEVSDSSIFDGGTSSEDSDLQSAIYSLLSNKSWSTSVLYYGFPDVSYYDDNSAPNDENDGYVALSSVGIDAIEHAFSVWEELIPVGLIFTEDDSSIDIAVAGSSVPSTAWAYLPSDSQDATYSGNIWFGSEPSYNDLFFTETSTAYIGSYEYYIALHEIGHSLGLKHPHEGTTGNSSTMSIDYDALENTVMSYRSYLGGGVGSLTPSDGNYPQSLMALDIAAIQAIYGADYTTLSGDTVYYFDPDTGQMYIDGVSTGETVANVVFRTLWDGNGTDTIDLSDYSTSISSNLSEGGKIILDVDNYLQRSLLLQSSYFPEYASANIYMSLLYNGDTRSLIENIITGTGNDEVSGNEADNVANLGTGVNIFEGGDGADTLQMSVFSSAISVLYDGSRLTFYHSGASVEVESVEYLSTYDVGFSISDILAAFELNGSIGIRYNLLQLLDPGYVVEDSSTTALDLSTTTNFTAQNGGSFTTSAEDTMLTQTTNTWSQLLVGTQVITADMVLSFDFSSSNEGELHGIVIEDDGTLDDARLFKLFGSQELSSWNTDYETYDIADGTVHYEIAVGQYLAGLTFDRIVFFTDDDAYGGSNSTFSNVVIDYGTTTVEVEPDTESDDISTTALDLSTTTNFTAQNGGSFTTSAEDTMLTQTTNTWSQLLVGTQVITADMVLSFDFSSSNEGELHGIVIEDDGTLDDARLFKLFGSQELSSWNTDYETYDIADGTVHYEIAVGQYLAGLTFDRIVFFTDDDAYGGSNSTFSNVVIDYGLLT